MPTQAICPRYAFGRRMRVTKLDGCGRPVVGSKNQVVTTGFTAVDISPNVLTGDEITVKNAGGDLCISDKALDSIKWLNIKITLCTQDPDLIALLNPTWYEEVDENGNPIGFRVDTTTTYASAFALELWQDVTGVDVCANPSADGSWGYLLLPFCQGGTLGDISITNKEALTVFNGRTLPNPKWGVGPYNVRQDPSGNPKPLLSAVASTQPLVWFVTSLTPPTAECGGQGLPQYQLATPTAPAQVGSGTQSTITASWTAVSGAIAYVITATPPSGPALTSTIPSTATQGTVTGLQPGTSYQVTITAKGDGVNSLDSLASSATAMSTAALNRLASPGAAVAGTPTTHADFKITFPTVTSATSYTVTAVKHGTVSPVAGGTVTVSGGTVTAEFIAMSGVAAADTVDITATAIGDHITYSDSLPTTTVSAITLT